MKYMPINDENILFFAFRYALGRTTTAPSIVVDEITKKIKRIRVSTRNQMRREIIEAIANDEAGHPCDIETWAALEVALR